MQHDDAVGLGLEQFCDGVEMFAALGEHERIATFGQFAQSIGCDPSRAHIVAGDRAEDLLDARVDGQLRWIKAAVSGDEHASGRGLDLFSPGQGVPDRAALHGDDRVVSVAALRGRGQSGDRTCRDIAQQAFDREGGYVMALVDDDVAVAG